MSGTEHPAPPARELARRVRARESSAREVALAHLERARRVQPVLHAFLDLDEPDVLAQADGVDARVACGEALPLAGVPVAVKDNICVLGRPATAGSRLLEHWRAPYDATVAARLRQAGAVLFGKASCDEFAMGSSNEHCAYGPVRNPWDPGRVPGGSSGGSAAAVASRAAAAALGSDTGGSVRQPAAFCGIVGLKPTYGRVSRHGLIAFASSLDQVGPLARDVEDAALLLAAIAGPDGLDATCAPDAPPSLHPLPEPAGFRFGVPAQAFGDGLEPGVRTALDEVVRALESVGGERVDVELPHADDAVAVYSVIASAEASSNLARYDGVRYGRRAAAPTSVTEMITRTRTEGFGPEVRRRILLGTHVLSAGYAEAYYRQAHRVRALIARELDAALALCDVVLTPTAPTTAFRLGERLADPLAMYLSDVFTVPANLAGLPAVSLPCALVGGLPVGAQLVARRFAERDLLAIARLLEGALGFAQRHALPA